MSKQKEKKSKEKKESKKGVIRKNTTAKVLRVFLWGMLAFLTIRGVVSILKPDQTDTLVKQIGQVEEVVQADIARNTELLSFTEEFMRDWQTYTADEAEFKNRLKPYVVPAVLEQQDIHDFASSSRVTYVNAYRMKAYSGTQYDVFVETTSINTRVVAAAEGAEGTQENVTAESSQVFKVPVQVTEDLKYIVEGIPLLVSDYENLPTTYRKDALELEGIEDVSAYQETISNYLNAYFTESSSVTDYYLAADTDKNKLYGFLSAGQFELVSVNEVRAFRKSEGEVLCLVNYQVRNLRSQEVTLQQCNIILDDSELERLYIKDMDTKVFNLKGEKTS